MKNTIKTLVLLSFAAASGISMAQGVNHDSRMDNRQVDKMQRVDQASEHRQNERHDMNGMMQRQAHSQASQHRQNEVHNMNGMMQQKAHSQRNRDRVERIQYVSREKQRRMYFAQVKHNQRSHRFHRSHHQNQFAR